MRSALLFTLAGLLFTAGCRSGPPPVPADPSLWEPERHIAARPTTTTTSSGAERFWRSWLDTHDRYHELVEKQADHRRAHRRLDRKEATRERRHHRR